MIRLPIGVLGTFRARELLNFGRVKVEFLMEMDEFVIPKNDFPTFFGVGGSEG